MRFIPWKRTKDQSSEEQKKLSVEKRDAKGNISFPEKSRFATELSTRKFYNKMISEGFYEQSWRKALFDVHTGKWIIVHHTLTPKITSEGDQEKTQILNTQASYKEALESLLTFENGTTNLGDEPPEDVPANYYILMAEYDGIILDEHKEFHPTLNGQIVTNGKFDQEAVARVQEKTKLSTQTVRDTLSLSNNDSDAMFYGTTSLLSKRGLLNVGVDKASIPDITALQSFLIMGNNLIMVEKLIKELKELKDFLKIAIDAINQKKKITSIDSYPYHEIKANDEKNGFSRDTGSTKEKEYFSKMKYLTKEAKILSEETFKNLKSICFEIQKLFYIWDLRLSFMATHSEKTEIKKEGFGRIRALIQDPVGEEAGENHYKPKGIDTAEAIAMASSDLNVMEPPALDQMIAEFETLRADMQEKLDKAQHLMAGPLSSTQTPIKEDEVFPHQIAVVLGDDGLTSYEWLQGVKKKNTDSVWPEHERSPWQIKKISCRTQFNILASSAGDFKSEVLENLTDDATDKAAVEKRVNEYMPTSGKVLSLQPYMSVLPVIKANILKKRDAMGTLRNPQLTGEAVDAFTFRTRAVTEDDFTQTVLPAQQPRRGGGHIIKI